MLKHTKDPHGWSLRPYGNRQRDHESGASVWYYNGVWHFDRADCEERKYRAHPLGEDAPADGTGDSEYDAMRLALEPQP